MDEHHHSSRICLCSNTACCVGFGTSSAQLRANQWLGETWWVTEHVFRLVHIMTRVRCILGSRGIGRTWTARANLFHLLERKPEPLSLSILWFFHFGHWVLVSKAKHYIFNPLATKAGLYCCVRPHLMKNARTNHVWFSRLAGFRCKSAKLLQALACCANILMILRQLWPNKWFLHVTNIHTLKVPKVAVWGCTESSVETQIEWFSSFLLDPRRTYPIPTCICICKYVYIYISYICTMYVHSKLD